MVAHPHVRVATRCDTMVVNTIARTASARVVDGTVGHTLAMRARGAAGDGSPTLHMAEGTTFTVTQNVHAKGDVIVDGKISTKTCVGMHACQADRRCTRQHT